MQDVLIQALGIWRSGGWAMFALAANAIILFTVGFNVWMDLRERASRGVPERMWRGWIDRPEDRRGHVGKLLDFVLGARDLDDLSIRIDELEATELAPIQEDLRFMRRAVSTAPLLGLLGTVTGMLATFAALASGAGGDQTMDLVAGGISEALITTETGLVIALPGIFFQYRLSRQRDRYQAFLAHVESVCAQAIWRRSCLESPSGPPHPGDEHESIS